MDPAGTEVYTYYPTGKEPEIRSGPLDGTGNAWVRGAYKPPTFPSALNVRVGRAGIKVWMVMQWLGFYDRDVHRMLENYGNVLTPEDVKAALSFYTNNLVDRAEIDRKIAEEAA